MKSSAHLLSCLCLCSTIGCATTSEATALEASTQAAATTSPAPTATTTSAQLAESPLQLGVLSNSLTVKDLQASKAFYAKLGFTVVAGKAEQKWLILQNGTHTIGIFEGQFERNIMTFNPGWNHKQETLSEFTDVRDIQATLLERGLELTLKADPKTDGPASIMLVDPDGNPILFDQHVPRPAL